MATSRPMSAEVESRIDVAIRVARLHDSALPLSELTDLMPNDTNIKSLTSELGSPSSSSGRYSLTEGFVIPQGIKSPQDFQSRREYSAANLRTAKWFSRKIGNRNTLAIAVSGSTSYRAASKGDDVDLFCVTRTGTMWIFLTRSLLLARASRLLGHSRPPICLSCVMDLQHAEDIFSIDNGALFARDALAAKSVEGGAVYAHLLKSATWMNKYFPKLYSARIPETDDDALSSGASAWESVADRFLFVFVGAYIRCKAWLHNRNLAKKNKGMNAFRVRVGRDHLIYESAKYAALRGIYTAIKPAEPIASANEPPGDNTIEAIPE